jgi:hypothetical protein
VHVSDSALSPTPSDHHSSIEGVNGPTLTRPRSHPSWHRAKVQGGESTVVAADPAHACDGIGGAAQLHADRSGLGLCPPVVRAFAFGIAVAEPALEDAAIRLRDSGRASPSPLRAGVVAEVNHPSAERRSSSSSSSTRTFSGSDRLPPPTTNGDDGQMTLVDQPCLERMGGEGGTSHREITSR